MSRFFITLFYLILGRKIARHPREGVRRGGQAPRILNLNKENFYNSHVFFEKSTLIITTVLGTWIPAGGLSSA